MMDEETQSLWDPMTGEAFRGQMAGKKMEIWPILYATVKEELSEFPNTELFYSDHRNPALWIFRRIFKPLLGLDSRGFIPPYFFRTMSAPIDPRLPKLTQGLGVIEGNKAKYYPSDQIRPGEEIRENWGKKTLVIYRKEKSASPVARWENNDQIPMQVLSRWYGFAFTYPHCDIYKNPNF